MGMNKGIRAGRRKSGRNKVLSAGWTGGLGMGMVALDLLTRARYGCVTDVVPSRITSTKGAPMTGGRVITCPSF